MNLILTIVAVWFLVSVPLAMLVARILAAKEQAAYFEEF
jgi:hypothetical protein